MTFLQKGMIMKGERQIIELNNYKMGQIGTTKGMIIKLEWVVLAVTILNLSCPADNLF